MWSMSTDINIHTCNNGQYIITTNKYELCLLISNNYDVILCNIMQPIGEQLG